MRKLDDYELILPDELEERARAIKNWKMLKLKLVMLILCGLNINGKKDREKDAEEEEAAKKKNAKWCREWIAPKIIDPMNKWKVMWDICVGSLYLVAFYQDSFLLAFWFRPLKEPAMRNLQLGLTFLFLVDMIITPFTGVKKKAAPPDMEEKKLKK